MKNSRNHVAIAIVLAMAMSAGIVYAQDEVEADNGEATFKFIANTLQNFRRTGRLYDEIGLDGSEYQDFIQLLQDSYQGFIRDFAPDSHFCNFYRDPRNGIMEIEEKATLAFQYLPELPTRLQLYARSSQQFLNEIQRSYGGSVLANIDQLKKEMVTFEMLPTRNLDTAEIVNFADTACR